MHSIITGKVISEAIQLRKHLHSYPELSGNEESTAGHIRSVLLASKPDQLIDQLGGHGLAAVYDSGKDGPCVLLRADLDALPIEEINTLDHKSRHSGMMHACGHDGHMAILAAVSMLLEKHRPSRGRVVLLFQPEEENGQGAAKVIADPKFQAIKPDQVYALHNLPGFPKNKVLIREGPFAAASKGVIIQLTGRSSHAAHPEQGHSPVHMMTELMGALQDIPGKKEQFRDFCLLTIIHARLGEVAFGTNPGKATVMATLRTYRNDDMERLNHLVYDGACSLGKKHDIRVDISYTEEFPATLNDREACNHVREAARASGAELLEIGEAFRWSEDFGHFTGMAPGALFGLGAGEHQASLHNPDYDFPDDIIPTGAGMFFKILQQTVKLQ